MSDEKEHRNMRPPRPGGRDIRRPNAFRMAMRLVLNDALYRLGAALPHVPIDELDEQGNLIPRSPGRKPELPPEAYLVFTAFMAYARCSDRDTQEWLQDPHIWDPIRAELHARFPQYPRLEPGGLGPSRWQFLRWKAYLQRNHLLLNALIERHIDLACEQARAMGMFDENRTDLTNLHLADAFIGDGTSAKARYDAAPGDLQLNTVTGELEQIRHDPDARRQNHKSEDDVETSETAGIYLGLIHATTGFPNEVVALDLFHIPGGKGSSEAIVSMPRLGRLAKRLPGAKAALWDKAMHGKEIDQAYDMGLMLNAKVSQAPGGGPKEVMIEQAKVRRGQEVVGELPLVAIGGAAHVRVPTGSGAQDVRLTPTKRIKRANPGGRGRPWRWYAEYEVPDDARIPRAYRSGQIRVRLDTTDEDRRRGINRAENLRPVAEGDELWSTVGGPRSRAEGLFSKTKQGWVEKRIPAVGVTNSLIHLLGFELSLNVQAANAYEKRTGQHLGRPPDPGIPAAA